MTHINYLPDSDGDPADWENFNQDDPNTWPPTSFAGRERDLADLLNDEAMDYYETMDEYDDGEFHFASFALYNLLMMNLPCFLMLTDYIERDDWYELRQIIRDDANENSGEYFYIRLTQRLDAKRTLRKLASGFRDHTEG